ncbi:S24 family peptidase [Sphingorhabdus pulchriflava]|uniref:S24 family peptidase n=2 Tax=Sphingorhabdus pulchriflava TaxID=2292257 RepID=A0A371BJN1_9SPHN|nr:S24 family peptidase [Sphingorhabdus pulchriflava]RDV07767.1 S24 family peptidase [Sphingorhabdus pulchriflava]
MVNSDPRAELDRLVQAHGDDYSSLSRLIGRNPAYIQQYIKRGSPKHLPERERNILARYYGVAPQLLGAPEEEGAKRGGLKLVPKLAVGASAGAGALAEGETLAGKVGFDEAWLRKLGVEPANVSLIRVEGDSMQPVLSDGDDIMVDKGAALKPLRDGIHVIRIDGVLMVKRLARAPGGRLSVLSDNPAYPSWPDRDPVEVQVVGRVVWVGRRL